MILSISRRTDVPAFYMNWFLNRQNEGYVLTRNPMNRKQISRVCFSDVTAYVFWTKDPRNLVKYFRFIDKPFMTQVTITPYMDDVEAGVKDKREIIEALIELSNLTDNKRVVWRYDPILFTDRYSVDYHLRYFEKLCKKLEGYVSTCIISFVEIYKKIIHLSNHFQEFDENDFVMSLKAIAQKYSITLKSCGAYNGIEKASCIDPVVLKHMGITGYCKDKYQREQCNCIESVDIGAYNTCVHHCIYCYANQNHGKAYDFFKSFDHNSEILGQPLLGDEIIKDKVIRRHSQISLFD